MAKKATTIMRPNMDPTVLATMSKTSWECEGVEPDVGDVSLGAVLEVAVELDGEVPSDPLSVISDVVYLEVPGIEVRSKHIK
jgi:hypothetical protein